jgi:hypothetical protein
VAELRASAHQLLVEKDNLLDKIDLTGIVPKGDVRKPMEDVLGWMPSSKFTAAEQKEMERMTYREVKLTNGNAGQYTDNVNLLEMNSYRGPMTQHDKVTVSHEFGHHISYQVKSIMEGQTAFYKERTAGEALVKLPGFRTKKGKPPVMGRLDDFAKTRAYAGREYSDGRTPEIISVGVELMWKDPVWFAKTDPGYFDLIVKLLKGIK